MNFKSTLFTLLTAGFLSSCASTTFYQVYKTEASDNLSKRENALVYEDENCKVLYNLWEDGGNIGFQFYNKTEEPLYLHMNESFYILNDVAYDYFRDRVVTYSSTAEIAAANSSYSGASVTGFNFLNLLQTNQAANTSTVGSKASSGKSVSYQEEEIITVPPHASKIIAEYNIHETVLRNCDLYLYPKKRQIETVDYNSSSSPLQFSNRITYSVGRNSELQKFENNFYVSQISNYPEKEFTVEEYDEFCGEKDRVKTKFFKSVAPDKFYVRYKKENNDSRKH